jgi:hypothetical protein
MANENIEPSPEKQVSESNLSQTKISANTDLDAIADPLIRYTQELAGNREPYAPVKLPSPNDMTVRLVDITQLQRLDELREDAALMQTIFWTTIGALVGVLTNIFTSNQNIDTKSWILILLLAGGASIFGFLNLRASKRSEKLRRRILYDPPR